MRKIILALVVTLITLLPLRAVAKAIPDPVHKPAIAYVTDSVDKMVEFTEGDCECNTRRHTFTLTVEDSLFCYDSLGRDAKGTSIVNAIVQINDTRELRRSFTMRVNCYNENGNQVYFTTPGEESGAVVEWLLFNKGYVQLDIPGSRKGQWLTVLIPCDEHFLGY